MHKIVYCRSICSDIYTILGSIKKVFNGIVEGKLEWDCTTI